MAGADVVVATGENEPARVRSALDQLGATDDCGFSPFSVDEKPKHGSPDFARDVAFQKITAREQGAKLAGERLGI